MFIHNYVSSIFPDVTTDKKAIKFKKSCLKIFRSYGFQGELHRLVPKKEGKVKSGCKSIGASIYFISCIQDHKKVDNVIKTLTKRDPASAVITHEIYLALTKLPLLVEILEIKLTEILSFRVFFPLKENPSDEVFEIIFKAAKKYKAKELDSTSFVQYATEYYKEKTGKTLALNDEIPVLSHNLEDQVQVRHEFTRVKAVLELNRLKIEKTHFHSNIEEALNTVTLFQPGTYIFNFPDYKDPNECRLNAAAIFVQQNWTAYLLDPCNEFRGKTKNLRNTVNSLLEHYKYPETPPPKLSHWLSFYKVVPV